MSAVQRATPHWNDEEYSSHLRPVAPLHPVVANVAAYWFGLPDDWKALALTAVPRGLLVGEQPGPSSNPRLPLWPYPPGSAGGRLHRMSGVPVGEYLVRLARCNVAPRPVARWDAGAARQRGLDLLAGLPDGCRVVAVGARARDALGAAGWLQPYPAFLPGCGPDVTVVAVPHTSGRSREYNHADVRARAGHAVRWAAGLEEDPCPRT